MAKKISIYKLIAISYTTRAPAVEARKLMAKRVFQEHGPLYIEEERDLFALMQVRDELEFQWNRNQRIDSCGGKPGEIRIMLVYKVGIHLTSLWIAYISAGV